jgi:hypothetical protein
MHADLAPILHRASPALFARDLLAFHPDDTQTTLLDTRARRVILNCTRQWGKSTVTAAKAVHEAMFREGSLTLVVSPSERQSAEFLRKCRVFLKNAGQGTRRDGVNPQSLLLENGSRIVALPNSEDTIRGFSGVSLLLVDEASRVPDGLYEAVLPMVAVSGGSIWLLSTPAGRRGFFWEEWQRAENAAPGKTGDADTVRLKVTAPECGRIPKKFLEEQRAARGDLFFRQEYLCEFVGDGSSLFAREMVEGLVTDLILPLEPSVGLPSLSPTTRAADLEQRRSVDSAGCPALHGGSTGMGGLSPHHNGSNFPKHDHWVHLSDGTRHLKHALPTLPGSTAKLHPYLDNPGPWTLVGTRYFGGLDLGQAVDSTALVVVAADTFVARERDPLTMGQVRHTVWTVVAAERFALGTAYTDIVYEVSRRFSRSPLAAASTLVIDATGVGAAVWDLFGQQRLPVELSGVVLGAGRAESSSGGKTVVPKLDLVDGLRVAMEAGQLFFARGAVGVELLMDEVCQLEASFRESGSVMVEARAGAHDDLAIALMLAVWAARKRGPVSPAVQVREAEARKRLQLAI